MTAKRNPAPARNVKSSSYSSVTRNGRTTVRARTVYRNGSVQSYSSSGPAAKVKPASARGGSGGGGSKKRTAAGLIAGGDWITGENDVAPSCVATAIANSLLSVKGVRVTDSDVMQLHKLSGNSGGVSIAECLETLCGYGLAGHTPATYMPVTPLVAVNGLIIGMTDGVNDHAVTLTPAGLISWGAPLDADLAEAWAADGEAWFIDWLGEGGN